MVPPMPERTSAPYTVPRMVWVVPPERDPISSGDDPANTEVTPAWTTVVPNWVQGPARVGPV
jgi:hypothetical protein